MSGTIRFDSTGDRIGDYKVWHLAQSAGTYTELMGIELTSPSKLEVMCFGDQGVMLCCSHGYRGGGGRLNLVCVAYDGKEMGGGVGLAGGVLSCVLPTLL